MATLSGKTAIVTGGSRGIGREVALRLARDGAFVVVHYGARRAAAEQTLKAIETAGGAGCIVGADLNEADAATNLFAEIDTLLSQHDREGIDILINNAGATLQRDLTAITVAEYDQLFALLVRAPLFLAQQAAQRMGAGGRIINISSMVGEKAFGGHFIAYGAAKAAIDYMTVSMAATLGPRGITVNAVAPGATATDLMGAALADPRVMQSIESSTALRAVGQPQDIASVVAFLASDDARWITGERIRASGGTQL